MWNRVSLYEFLTRFVLPLCTALPHPTEPTPISSVTTIIDLEQVSLTAMWNLRSHLAEASTLATANYPETLNTIAVVNSPSFFPTIWGWIKVRLSSYYRCNWTPVVNCVTFKGWFDEGTRRKVHVLGKDPGPTLRTLIDPANLPRAYGGELEWKFEDEPILDDDAKKLIGEMPKGPVLLENGKVTRPQSQKAKINGKKGKEADAPSTPAASS